MKGGSKMNYTAYYTSPIGLIQIQTTDHAIISLAFYEGENNETLHTDDHPLLTKTINQLEEYFQGKRKEFELPLEMKGTNFQTTVLTQVCTIPYGKRQSYKDIARQIKNEKAVRAVGSANRTNHLLLLIPCHRVISSDGKLSGYAGGLWRKEWLLKHEIFHSTPKEELIVGSCPLCGEGIHYRYPCRCKRERNAGTF